MQVITTSYFGKSSTNPNAVSITFSRPVWFKGKHYSKLAPPWDIISSYKKGQITAEQYESDYRKRVLDRLDPKTVARELGENAVLLCYEKASDFCHRHIVAQWLQAGACIMVEELK